MYLSFKCFFIKLLESSFLTVMKHLPYDRYSVQHFMRIGPFNPQSNPSLKIMQPSLTEINSLFKVTRLQKKPDFKAKGSDFGAQVLSLHPSCLAADKPSSACFSLVFTGPPLRWPFTLIIQGCLSQGREAAPSGACL